MLADYCSTSGKDTGEQIIPTVMAVDKKKRRKELLEYLREGRERPHGRFTDNTKRPGRPRQAERNVTFGLRVTCLEKSPKLIRAPLGDKNYITMKLPVDASYSEILKKVATAFFPNGQNNVIGAVKDYRLAIVNHVNQGVSDCDFSIAKYVFEKMISGQLKLYLLCTSDAEESSESPEDVVDDLPQIIHHSRRSSATFSSDEQKPTTCSLLDDNCVVSQSSPGLDTTPSHGVPPGEECTVAATYILLTPSGEVLGRFGAGQAEIDADQTEADAGQAVADAGEVGADASQAGGDDVPTEADDGHAAVIPAEAEVPSSPETIQDCLTETLCAMVNVNDPIEVLRNYQQKVLQGRPLDPSTEFDVIEGASLNISVSRYNLFVTAAEELLDDAATQHNYRVPLEVDFYGEGVSDFGGPRKEFFNLIFNVLLDENQHFFKRHEISTLYKMTNRLEYTEKKYYYVAGLICGMSMLQSGPMPCFLEEEDLEAVLSGNGTESQRQFSMGLDVLGIVTLIKLKPCVRTLLRPSDNSGNITRVRLLKLLQPSFAIEGSNLRMEQEEAYSLFRNYIREVAAGRRTNMNLGKILQFTTGTSSEPVLGFGMPPSLHFQKEMPLNFPRAHTCINRLLFPICSTRQTEVYDAFDIAFSSEYFGLA